MVSERITSCNHVPDLVLCEICAKQNRITELEAEVEMSKSARECELQHKNILLKQALVKFEHENTALKARLEKVEAVWDNGRKEHFDAAHTKGRVFDVMEFFDKIEAALKS